jgi:hypothetical protein
MKKKIKKICKKHYWDLYDKCPFCGLEYKVTQSGDTLSFEMSLDIPMEVKTVKRKSGIVTFKTYEDGKV